MQYRCFFLLFRRLPLSSAPFSDPHRERRRRGHKDYYIKINDREVRVSKAIYYEYKRPAWREKKRSKVRAAIECSFDALTECGVEISSTDESLEELIEDRQLLASLLTALDELTDDERGLIDALYYKTQTEREFSSETGVPQQTIHKRKNAILQKLKGLLRI